MKKQPTYSPAEIKKMSLNIDDAETYNILLRVMDEEIDLYEEEDMPALVDVSMLIFTRTLLIGSLKNLDKNLL